MVKEKNINLICKARLEKYLNLTKQALAEAKKHINNNKKGDADEIISMVEAYLSDSLYFQKKRHYVNAFACINYAHGWLDAGARLKIFNVKNTKLFTVS